MRNNSENVRFKSSSDEITLEKEFKVVVGFFFKIIFSLEQFVDELLMGEKRKDNTIYLVEFSVGHIGVDSVAIIRDLVFIGKIGLEDAKDFTRDTFNEFFEFLDIFFSFL